MTENELVEGIVSALEPMLAGFLEEKTDAEVAFEGEIDSIKERIEGEADAVIRSVLEEGLKAHEVKRPAPSAGRRKEAARAFVEAASRLGLAVSASASKAGEQKRTPRAQVKAGAEAILAGMVEGEFKTKVEMISEAGLSDEAGGAAVARLKREGKLVSNGQRGRGAAYRLT